MRIVEVAPRDGLQNEAAIVATADKVRFVELLTDAGLTEIEVSSFVSPKRIPQLADASEVFAQLSSRPNVRYSALVPNEKGLERALAAGVRAIAVFTAASETFTQRNIGVTIADSLAGFRNLIPAARAANCWIRAYVSTAFVCPYEGSIAPEAAAPIVSELLSMGVDEVSIGDTIGHAEPDDTARLTETLLPILPLPQFAYHFHDTRGTALNNVAKALEYGITIFDSAAGGTGGCPYAPGAPGNLATERLVSFLEAQGIPTGTDRQKLAIATEFLASKLGRKLLPDN